MRKAGLLLIRLDAHYSSPTSCFPQGPDPNCDSHSLEVSPYLHPHNNVPLLYPQLLRSTLTLGRLLSSWLWLTFHAASIDTHKAEWLKKKLWKTMCYLYFLSYVLSDYNSVLKTFSEGCVCFPFHVAKYIITSWWRKVYLAFQLLAVFTKKLPWASLKCGKCLGPEVS